MKCCGLLVRANSEFDTAPYQEFRLCGTDTLHGKFTPFPLRTIFYPNGREQQLLAADLFGNRQDNIHVYAEMEVVRSLFCA